MADKKITELNVLTASQLTGTDVFAIVDVSENETKQITRTSLMANPGPIGTTIASTAIFTQLEISGSTPVITGISDDISTSALSSQLVTADAIKTYVDSQTSGAEHNTLSGLQGGDATPGAEEYYHLTQDVYNGLFSNSPSIGIGDSTGTHIIVDYSINSITAQVNSALVFGLTDDLQSIGSDTNLTIDQTNKKATLEIDNTSVLNVNALGLQLETGARVSEFSTDITLSESSNSLIPTQHAVKEYVQNNFALDWNINEVISGDTTAVIADFMLVNTSTGPVTISIVTTVDGIVRIKKTTSDANDVTVVGINSTIDGLSDYTISTTTQSYGFLVYNGDVFVI